MDGFYVYLVSDADDKLFPKNVKTAFTIRMFPPIQLDPGRRWEVGLVEVMLPTDDDHDLLIDEKIKDGGPIFVYLDCIAGTRVSNSSAKLLRILNPHFPHNRFNPGYYLPVEGGRLPQLSVLLTNRLGERYRLASNKIPTILVLHFRPI